MDGGAKHARDSGNPHAPGAQAGIWATSPHFLWARSEGEGIFIISDINNSADGVEIRRLEMNHSGNTNPSPGRDSFLGCGAARSQRGRPPGTRNAARPRAWGLAESRSCSERCPRPRSSCRRFRPHRGGQPASFFAEGIEGTRFVRSHFPPPTPSLSCCWIWSPPPPPRATLHVGSGPVPSSELPFE